MATARSHNNPDLEQQPVSPLSPRSEAIWFRQQESAGPVSPHDPRKSFLPAEIFDIPKRKAVSGQYSHSKNSSRSGLDKGFGCEIVDLPRISQQYLGDWQNHAPSSSDLKVYHVEVDSKRRSRSRSVVGVMEMPPELFLQDLQDHAPASQRPRSGSVPANSNINSGRKRCYNCGTHDAPTRKAFIKCGTCINIYYCTPDCYQGHLCHSRARRLAPNGPVPPPKDRVPAPNQPMHHAQPSGGQIPRLGLYPPAAIQNAQRFPTHSNALRSQNGTARPDVESQKRPTKSFRRSTWFSAMVWGVPLLVVFLVILCLAIKFSK